MCMYVVPYNTCRLLNTHKYHVACALPLRGAHTVSTLAHMRRHMVMRGHTTPLHARNKNTHTNTGGVYVCNTRHIS